jgi:hypothetical protein
MAHYEDQEDSILLVSELAGFNWTHASTYTGDLLLRMANHRCELEIEMIREGIKYRYVVPFDNVEVVLTEDILVEPEKTSSPSQRDQKKRKHVGAAIHFAFRRPPTLTFLQESWVDGDPTSAFFEWTPCMDNSLGDIVPFYQISAYLNWSEAGTGEKLAELVSVVARSRVEQMQNLECGREASMVGISIMKHFPGYGHFRGTVESFDGEFFSVLYTDGDCEELYSNELHNLLATSLPKGHRLRRRRRSTVMEASYPRLDPRVGIAYQVAEVPECQELQEELNDSSHLMVPIWSGIPSDDRRTCQVEKIRGLKQLFGCGDIGEHEPTGLLQAPEQDILAALQECSGDEKQAAAQLNDLVKLRPNKPWTQEDCSLFTTLMIRHKKNFRAVQKDFQPPRKMSEILQYYYSEWKKKSRHYATVKEASKALKQKSQRN